jgi:hypothetical protein
MRAVYFTGLFTMGLGSWAQGPVINEVLPGLPGTGAIELFNPGKQAVDLAGWTLAVQGASHRITTSLIVPVHGSLVITCGTSHTDPGIHIDLDLPACC